LENGVIFVGIMQAVGVAAVGVAIIMAGVEMVEGLLIFGKARAWTRL
jgi:hypothetical protein